MYCGGTSQVEVNSFLSREVSINSGIAQSDDLSLRFWNVYIDDVVEKIKTANGLGAQFRQAVIAADLVMHQCFNRLVL